MDKWEYVVLKVRGSLPDLEGTLNQMGGQCWELVSVDNMNIYMKRRKDRVPYTVPHAGA